METNETPNPETPRKRRTWRGELATEAGQDAATASTETPDDVESAPAAEAPRAPEPELTERQAWKRRRAIALGLIRP
jgi:hypothetical protein